VFVAGCSIPAKLNHPQIRDDAGERCAMAESAANRKM
jgi:hypothetical protein